MLGAGSVLEMDPLGLRVEFVRTAQETDGELLEMTVTGRPRGFLAQRHVHSSQVERLEVISGAMKVKMNGREHILTSGQSIEVPAGTPHTQAPVGEGPGSVRIQVRPAGRTQAFLEQVARLCREGKVTRAGYPRPVAGAELVLEYSDTGHAASPPLHVQRRIAGLVMGLARTMLYNPRWPWHAAVELGEEFYYPKQYERAHPSMQGGDFLRPARTA